MNRDQLLLRLRALPFDPSEYWLLAGGAMVLYGFREETADIDLGCTAALADRLEAEGFPCRITEGGKRWFKLGDSLEIFEEWLSGPVCMEDGVPVVSIPGLVAMKRALGREKDLRDIALIEKALAWQKSEMS